jgi:putative hydrolase of the HAD superfamily
MKKIAVIYDLDQTILPTRSIPADTFQPVFEAIKAANKGTVQETVLEEAFEELWRKSMEVVAQEYNFSQAMFDAGKNALIHTDYQLVLKPFDDFEVIKEIPSKRFLVTTGLSKLQQAKIDALFQPGDFEAVFIDDPYQENRLGKMTIFSQIAAQHQLTADQVWIVGDNPDAEIAAGNALGMKTVQILRPGIAKGDTALHVIHSFHELKSLIAQDG